MKTFKPVAFLLSLYFLLTLAHAADLAPTQIVEKADQARAPSGAISFLVRVTDFKNNVVNNDSVYKVFIKGNELSLVETLEPVRLRGRKLLMNQNNLWFVVPTIKRPTRVSLQQRLTGEVANGDIARTNFAADYNAKIIGNEKVGSSDCYKLELTAKHKDVTYNKLWYWVDKSNFFPIRATFFALSGKPLKHANYMDFKINLGRPTMTRLVISDQLQPHKKSQLMYYNFRRENLDDSFFNKESLSE